MSAIAGLQMAIIIGLVMTNIAILLAILSCLLGMLALSLLAARHMQHRR